MFTWQATFHVTRIDPVWGGEHCDDYEILYLTYEAPTYQQALVYFECLLDSDELPEIPDADDAGRKLIWNHSSPKMVIYTVGWGMADRAYGGPEEGDWYFDYWNPLEAPYELAQQRGMSLVTAMPSHFPTEREATHYASMLNQCWGPILNKGRPEISSVASDGRYKARVQLGSVLETEPRERPHYE